MSDHRTLARVTEAAPRRVTGAPPHEASLAAEPDPTDLGSRPSAGVLAGLTTRRLAVIVLFVGLLATAVSIHVDSETFWHLSSGSWMLDHGRILDFNAFSHTAAGRRWIDRSWLSDVAMAGIHRSLGYAGLNLVTSLLIWFTLLAVYRSGRADTYVRALTVALAAATMAVSWSARPQIVSLLLAAVFNLILLRRRRDGDNRLWLLPVLMVPWVNLDGGFVIGLLLVGVTFAGELLTAIVNRLRPATPAGDPRAFALPLSIGAAGLACLLATVANPHGFALLHGPIATIQSGAIDGYTREWQSPDFHTRSAQFFIVLWLVTFALAGMSRRRLQITDLLLFGTFSAAALLATANIAVFAIVAAPILMRHGGALVSELEDHALRHGLVRARPRATLALNWVLLCLVTVATVIKLQWPLSPGSTELSMARTFPVGAVTYLRTHHSEGTLFNAYAFGSYLSWSLYPSHPVFVDGRTDLYDESILSDYVRTYMAQPGYDATLARHGVGVVLVERSAPIAHTLEASPLWVIAYRDWMSILFVRRRT